MKTEEKEKKVVSMFQRLIESPPLQPRKGHQGHPS